MLQQYGFSDSGAFIRCATLLPELKLSYLSKAEITGISFNTANLIKIELLSRPSIYFPFEAIVQPEDMGSPYDFISTVQGWMDMCSCHGSGDGGGDDDGGDDDPPA